MNASTDTQKTHPVCHPSSWWRQDKISWVGSGDVWSTYSLFKAHIVFYHPIVKYLPTLQKRCCNFYLLRRLAFRRQLSEFHVCVGHQWCWDQASWTSTSQRLSHVLNRLRRLGPPNQATAITFVSVWPVYSWRRVMGYSPSRNVKRVALWVTGFIPLLVFMFCRYELADIIKGSHNKNN